MKRLALFAVFFCMFVHRSSTALDGIEITPPDKPTCKGENFSVNVKVLGTSCTDGYTISVEVRDCGGNTQNSMKTVPSATLPGASFNFDVITAPPSMLRGGPLRIKAKAVNAGETEACARGEIIYDGLIEIIPLAVEICTNDGNKNPHVQVRGRLVPTPGTLKMHGEWNSSQISPQSKDTEALAVPDQGELCQFINFVGASEDFEGKLKDNNKDKLKDKSARICWKFIYTYKGTTCSSSEICGTYDKNTPRCGK